MLLFGMYAQIPVVVSLIFPIVKFLEGSSDINVERMNAKETHQMNVVYQCRIAVCEVLLLVMDLECDRRVHVVLKFFHSQAHTGVDPSQLDAIAAFQELFNSTLNTQLDLKKMTNGEVVYNCMQAMLCKNNILANLALKILSRNFHERETCLRMLNSVQLVVEDSNISNCNLCNSHLVTI